MGSKVAAATLNFSTLGMQAFVVDTHVLRVLRRFGLAGSKAPTWRASETIIAATESWNAAELMEFHALLKRLGQHICRADRIWCRNCPIAAHCRNARYSS